MSDWRTSSQWRSRARALALCLGLALAARAADAAVFTVDSTGDQPDAMLNGTCATAVVTCTLRAALQEANNTVGPHTINFTIAGAGPHTISPASALPALNQAITINGYSQPGSSPNTLAVGNDAVLKIELDGSLIAVDGVSGLTIWAGGCTVRGLVINRFTGYGVEITGAGVVLRGNFVGTSVAGTVGLGNNRGGVGSEGGIGLFAGGATIGGTAPADRNLVSGNNANCGRGIELWDASGNTIQGNYVGTNAAGTAAIPNGCGGIVLDGNAGVGSDNNSVGGAVAGAGNLVSGNQVEGIFVQVGSATNTIQGNTIGLNASGSGMLPNGAEGIKIFSNGNVVGGDDAFKRNVISGNATQGVRLQGASATGNAVRGNYIGTDATGAIDLGNTSHGVIVNAGAVGNTIGGSPAERNVISGNGSGAGVQGVRIDGAGTANNVVTANFIGTDAAGSGSLPNSAGGLAITNSAANNRVGGVAAGSGNRIALNTTYGVNLGPSAGTGNAVLGNAIYGNSDLGIDLLTDGVTPNDGGDGDTGPNDLLNFPDLTAATGSGGMLTVNFNLDVPAGSYRVEFFRNPSGTDPSGNGEGEVFAGARTLTHPGGGAVSFSHAFPGQGGDRITATTTFCTDGATCAAFGSTSEFSDAVQVSCCSLATAETASTVTVTAAGQFELRFNTAAGGGIDQFHDLAEDPTQTYDLAGGTATVPALLGEGLQVGGVFYDSYDATGKARLHLLEATPTRVKVRQLNVYGDDVTSVPGAQAIGDYTVLPSGRLAQSWTRRVDAAVTYTENDFDMGTRYDNTGPPLNAWTGYEEVGAAPPPYARPFPPSSSFWLAQIDQAGARTDFLRVLHRDWTVVNGFVADADSVNLSQSVANGLLNPYWKESTGATIPAGTRETWNNVVYFKPTNLASHADPAVTSRRDDYRGPSAITVGPGTQWQDAAEYTAGAGDFFNEAESAYAFDLDPASGLTFGMDGSTTTRYSPFFKIRRWRSFSETPIATFDADGGGPGPATLLRKNVDYKAAVKPVSRAHFANTLTWHCTLDDNSVTNTCTASGIDLDVGANGGLVSSGCPGAANCVEVVPARYGLGANFNDNTDYLAVPSGAADLSVTGGALEFWYQPNQDHTASGPLVFWRGNTANDCFVFEKTGANALRFTIHANAANSSCTSGGTPYSVSVASGSYSWRAKDWVHLRVTWSNSFPGRVAIWMNGVELAFNSGYSSVNVTNPPSTYIGGCSGIGCPLNSTGNADGVIDEVSLYFGPSEPVSIAHGGRVGAADEYLADSALNTLLNLAKVDGSRRGRYLYFGADAKFLGLNVSLAAAGGGVADNDLVWQYWRGGSGAWVTLAPTDGTRSLKQTGTVSWANPSGWLPMSISGGPDLYYVRAHLPVTATADYGPAPVERQIRTDILLFQYCPDVTTAGTFTFAVPPTTEVTLASFTATAGDSSVLVEWRTASELRNLGFHLYRATSADGPWQRLTSSLIPGLGSSAVGQSYSWKDDGLVNGTRHYYRLEDVDASSKLTSHGPVSAVPQAGASADAGTGGGKDKAPGKTAAAASSCPSEVLVAYQAAVGGDASASLRCTRHGDPEATSFTVLSRDSRQATVELRTGGFYALRNGWGPVRVFVPGFEFPQDAAAAALPYRRTLVAAVVGRRVELGGVRALELQAFRDLVPAALGKAEMQVGRDGTVKAGRRGLRSLEDGGALRRIRAGTSASASGFAKSELVTLLPSLFQGETKSAVVEIAPLRFDAQRRQLVLARRVRVKLLFTGREPGESGLGSVGRAPGPPKQLPSGEVLARLYTTSVGLHAATFEELFPGRSRGVPVTELRLSLQGEAVAFHVEPHTSAFGPGSRLYFHAERQAASTDYAGEVAYELRSARDGLRMAIGSAAPGSRVISTESVTTRRFETNRYYQPGLLEAKDPWLWEAASSGATRVVPFTLAGVSASGTAQLDVDLQGASESGQPVDHHVSVSVNGVLVGEGQFAGKKPHRISLSLQASLLREGANELSLTNVADTGVTSLVFLDRMSVVHPQASVLGDGRLSAVWPASGAASVAGVTGAPVVVDVTGSGDDASSSSAAARWLTGYAVAGGELRFEAQAGRRYEVVLASALRSPRIGAVVPTTLRSVLNQADYLLIGPQAFLAAAEPLVARREDQGLSAKAVAFEAIAAEFGHGRPSAEAIRSFIGYAYQSWSRPSPRYVVLLGDSTYDPRNFSGVSQPAPLPVLWTKTSYLWTASDPLLAAVNGEDSLPDLAIGRLPATSVEQAHSLVQKLLAWEESGQGLSGAATLVADNPDLAGDFEADVADIRASFLAGRETSVLKVGELGASTRPSVQQALDSGLSYLGYVGHGGAAVWASENVWNTWDAESLQAQSRQPLLLTLNCLNGYFVAPSYDSLSESLVKAEGRGAIAAFSPSGLSLDGPAHQYHRALMAELTSGRHERLGDALLAAQKTYATSGLMPELLSIYHLLGDPATRVR